jgi:hypothetical protein
MDTLPLPAHPDLAQYKKRAKALTAAANSAEEGAIQSWAVEWLRSLARACGIEITPFVQGSFDRAVDGIEAGVREKLAKAGQRLNLADAQFFIARAHGFERWSDFADHVERASRQSRDGDPFEAAVDAVVDGDLETLGSLLRQHPDLIRARSSRTHKATLLHYVAANGVEDFRQRTPPNAVAVATLLLSSGAEVDALADTYGGGKAQTTMNLTVSSTHPAGAGLQPLLVETLLDFGAAIDGLEDDGSPLMTALAFGYVEAAEALARRGARVDNDIAAAALGRPDLLRSFIDGASGVRPSLVRLDWMGLSSDPRAHLERALVQGCASGRTEAVRVLLGHGVDPAAQDNQGMTGLHWAAANGHVDVVKLLLEQGAPLETRNAWGGTVLGSTLHFAHQYPEDAAAYAAMIGLLLLAGAEVRAVEYPTGIAPIDEVLGRHGAT